MSVLEEDALLDIPGRRLDISGDIFIETENGSVVPIQNIPGPVQRIFTEFERLAKRLRVFVHPRIAHLIGKETLIARRDELLALLEDSLPKGAGNRSSERRKDSGRVRWAEDRQDTNRNASSGSGS